MAIIMFAPGSSDRMRFLCSFQIIWFWTGPGADLDVLRDWIFFDGFCVFYVFSNVFLMIWVFGGVENHQREKDGSQT